MGTKRIILFAILIALSTTIFAQNVPTSVLWGNTRVAIKSAAGDTIGYTSLLDLKNQFFTTSGGTMLGLIIATANGLAGTSNGNATNPTITLSTPVNGMVKANGTAFSAATVRTDYAEPTTALATGILKNTTGTGAHTIAVAGDFPVLNQNTTGTSANVTGIVAIANGGSGQSTQAAAITALTGSQTANYVLASNGTNTSLQALTVAMLPTSIPNANLANSSIIVATNSTGTDISANTPVSLGGTLTISVPDAGTAARGVITTGGQTLAGAKTFNGALNASGGFTSSLTSTLSGGVIYGTSSISSTTTLTTANNTVYADATSAAITLTLPTSPPDGFRVRIIKKNSTTNYVTIARGGTNTINGIASPILLISSGMPTTFSFAGTDWVQE